MIYAMYGYDAAPNDPFLDIVFEIGTLFGGSVFPGMNLVNAIPPRECIFLRLCLH